MNDKMIQSPGSCSHRDPAPVASVTFLHLVPSCLRASVPNSLFRSVLCLLVIACCSCGENEPDITVRTIPGTIMKIDAAQRRLTLRYVHEKSGVHREVEGDVLPGTEIFINGKLSTLADIKIGERAVIQGSIERKGDRTKISALKIDITRDESVTFDDGKSSGG
mgnify:CR=1 FL=1